MSGTERGKKKAAERGKMPPQPTRKKRKLSPQVKLAREVRFNEMKENILITTANLVGTRGYRDTSIQLITSKLGMAQGSFYLYFESRQALFDELLPHFGLQMLHFVRDRMTGTKSFLEADVKGMHALIAYLREHPWFWRIFNEAEVEAPKAWQRHHDALFSRYVHFLKRALENGELGGYKEEELDTLAHFLAGARDYVYRCILAKLHDGDEIIEIMESTEKTYRRFVESVYQKQKKVKK